MFRKLLISGLLLLLLSPSLVLGQVKSAFTGDLSTYRAELTTFMGPNLNQTQKNNLNEFLTRWDSASFSKTNMIMIVDISSQMSGRLMRAVPHFDDFLETINLFVDFKRDDAILPAGLED
ncbi:MAG: hypothetical protein IPJ37_22015 [Bacteroidales bacterium]|nr:hypothetical protein [Bacteroidales bacterium]